MDLFDALQDNTQLVIDINMMFDKRLNELPSLVEPGELAQREEELNYLRRKVNDIFSKAF